MLQFITHSESAVGNIDQALKAISGGCRWVQIRMKNADINTINQVIDRISPTCESNNVTLIIDDHVEIAKRKEVSGVHLGQQDLSTAVARKILGPHKIIGLTINSVAQAIEALGSEADYYGVGPWRFTSTKQRLAPVLGHDGVKEIISILKRDHADREIVVIGGIRAADIKDILKMGADGVAVSGEIASSASPELATRNFIEEINKQKTDNL